MISLYDITCVAGGLVRRRKILFLAQDDDASYTDQYDRLTKGWEIIVQVWQYMKLLVIAVKAKMTTWCKEKREDVLSGRKVLSERRCPFCAHVFHVRSTLITVTQLPNSWA